MRATRRLLLLGLGAGNLAATGLLAPQDAAGAERYPTRPIRIVAAFAAGGAVDITARIVADWLSNDLGQQVIVENRAGSGSNIAAAALINSLPDGYTIMFTTISNAI